MSQNSGFFTAQQLPDGNYDRVYTADEFAYYFSKFIGNGIFITPAIQLQVSQSPLIDMSVNVNIGDAYINGYWYSNTNIVNLSIEASDGVNSRIDLIVLRWDLSTRDIKLAVVKGVPSGSPVAPTVTRSDSIYELCLAKVNLKSVTTAVTNDIIQDTRSDSSVCGYVHAMVDQIDGTNLFQQFQSIFDLWYANLQEYETETKNLFEQQIADNQDEFELWFSRVKGQLSEDVAGHLLDLIHEENLVFYNIEITPEDFVEDSTYEKFPFRVDIVCEGVNNNYIPDVYFNFNEATSGSFAPISTIAGNVVSIFANKKSDETFYIPVIKCSKGSDY